jgi:hypothetical protein
MLSFRKCTKMFSPDCSTVLFYCVFSPVIVRFIWNHRSMIWNLMLEYHFSHDVFGMALDTKYCALEHDQICPLPRVQKINFHCLEGQQQRWWHWTSPRYHGSICIQCDTPLVALDEISGGWICALCAQGQWELWVGGVHWYRWVLALPWQPNSTSCHPELLKQATDWWAQDCMPQLWSIRSD